MNKKPVDGREAVWRPVSSQMPQSLQWDQVGFTQRRHLSQWTYWRPNYTEITPVHVASAKLRRYHNLFPTWLFVQLCDMTKLFSLHDFIQLLLNSPSSEQHQTYDDCLVDMTADHQELFCAVLNTTIVHKHEQFLQTAVGVNLCLFCIFA